MLWVETEKVSAAAESCLKVTTICSKAAVRCCIISFLSSDEESATADEFLKSVKLP